MVASNNLLETSDTLLHQLRYLQQKKRDKSSTRLAGLTTSPIATFLGKTYTICTFLVHQAFGHIVQPTCVCGLVAKCHISFIGRQRMGGHQYDKTYTNIIHDIFLQLHWWVLLKVCTSTYYYTHHKVLLEDKLSK